MKLRQWLKETKITIKKFAIVMEIHHSYIYKLIAGKSKPSEKLMNKIITVTRGLVNSKEDIKRSANGKENSNDN